MSTAESGSPNNGKSPKPPKKERTFPVEVSLGSVSVLIYRDPQSATTKAKKSAEGAPANGATDLPLSERTYDSYVVAYYDGSRRVRRRFKKFELAKAEAGLICIKLANADGTALELTGDDRRIHVAAVEFLKDTGVTLDLAAKEYAEAFKILNGPGIIEAARFYAKHGMAASKKGRVKHVADLFLAALKADKGDGYHYRDLHQRLGVLADHFDGEISEVTATQLDQWLRDLEVKGTPVKGKTRNHYRDATANLFHWAQKHGFLPRGLPTAADDARRVDDEGGEIAIFTAPEMQKLLAAPPRRLIPSLAIKAFSGVRTEEMIRMHWHHVHFDKMAIILTRDVTKTRKRRIIPMQENLIAWLTPFKGESGRICEQWARPQAAFQAWDRYAKKHGIDAGGNRFRHSYISYRTAQTSDLAKVSLESGNSVNVIQESYLELVTADEAGKWFSIFPSAPIGKST